MAKEPLFVSLFKESPLKGIEKHMEACTETALLLAPYFKAVLIEDWRTASDLYDAISEGESAADDMKQDIRSNLPRTLLMPISRQDLLELLHIQDKIPNTAKDISGLILGRKMVIPKEIHSSLSELVEHALKAVSIVNCAVQELHDAAHFGFSDPSTRSLMQLLNEVSEVEHQSDLEQRNIRKLIFDIESAMNPVDVIFVYQVVDLIGDLADEAESTSNRLLSITFS